MGQTKLAAPFKKDLLRAKFLPNSAAIFITSTNIPNNIAFVETQLFVQVYERHSPPTLREFADEESLTGKQNQRSEQKDIIPHGACAVQYVFFILS